MKYDFAEFMNYDHFKARFLSDKDGNVTALFNAARALEALTNDALINLVYTLYGKWPQNTNRGILLSCIKRTIQHRFYKELFHNEPTAEMLKRDEFHIQTLNLQDSTPHIEITIVDGNKIKKKKFKNEFSQKINNMDLASILAWAKELGIEQNKLDKHKDKSIGLAKMNISNMIRARLK